ncbi:unnamed protein product [Meganyctiphanes norvegica]|uniref:C2H2-type domain-containing protein n=1 Tax=Meganyctiphanes norvegica TaxID=48144 RepID=A0AAV2RR84_MEGNR
MALIWGNDLVKLEISYLKKKHYQCSECGKKFSYKCDLRVHLMTHTGEQPYKCSQCDKAFSMLRNQKSHMKTHSDEKPYQCSQCEKSFSMKSKLKSHLLSHTGCYHIQVKSNTNVASVKKLSQRKII